MDQRSSKDPPMYVNTGGGGKTQQQPLQNQVNASVRHNNPYPNSHTHQQPHYEHHQGAVAYVSFPYCNVAPPGHGNTGGNNVGVGGQSGHLVYQTSHQPQPQPLPTQQQIGLHNTEQPLHYFAKSAPLPTQMHHSPQQQSQISMITAVSHQRQYMLASNFFTLPPTLLSQQTRASILTNAAPQHAVAAATGGSMATQIQNSAPRNVAPSGPTTYVPSPYCNPPLLLGAAPTTVTPQPAPMLAQAAGMGQQPPSLQAYAHISGGMSTAPTTSTPINMETIGVSVGTSSNTEHNISIKPITNTNTKQRKHAIPIVHPDTMKEVPFEHLIDAQPKPEPEIQTEAKIETCVESVSIQTENDKSLTASIASDPSDVVVATGTQSISATETDKMDFQTQDQENYCDVMKETSDVEIATTLHPDQNENTVSQPSLQSASISPKICVYEDPNDTDADTNEHELDNEDDVPDGNLTIVCIDQELQTNISLEQQTDEIANTADPGSLQAVETDNDHSKETEAKSKDDPCGESSPASLEKNDEEKPKEIIEDLQPSISSFVVHESKRGKNRKNVKSKEKNQKKLKQQQNKSKAVSNQNEANNNAANSKNAANEKKATETKKPTKNEENGTTVNLKNTGASKKDLEPKNPPKVEDIRPTFIRYTLKELRDFSKSPQSLKTPLVICQKGDCISQLFVARQQHHLHHLTHQGQNLPSMNLQHHVQKSYHQMNFNESIEFVSGKRRVMGGGGAIARKHQDGINLVSTGNNNNNAALQAASVTTGLGGNMPQIQKNMQVIRINLSLNEEIKLSECKNAWQPKFVSNNSNNNITTSESGKNSNEDIEDVLKKVRGILNKLTAENFDVLLKEMTSISIKTTEKMEKIMLLIFEKTVSEPNFAPTYAKFCKVLFDEVEAERKNLFNNLLIKRLEREFELNVNNADAKERKLQQIMDKLNEATDAQAKNELYAELEYQEYEFRRRAWGTVRFIGEMYKLNSLSANRVLLCVESLLKHGNEEKLEYMCKLLTTVGNLLENGSVKSFNNVRMNTIFDKIQTIVKEAKDPSKNKTKICSRVRFMMQDLIDLRSKNWGQPSYSQSSHVAPRRRLTEDKNSNLASGSANMYERASSQRMSFGNSNRQNQSRSKEGDNYLMQKSTKSQYLAQREQQQQSIDLKKLNFSRGDDTSQATTQLGNSSNYVWRIVPGRQTSQSNNSQQSERASSTSSNQYQQKHQPQQQQQTNYWNSKNPNLITDTKAVLESCSSKDNQQLLNHLMEEYLDCLSSRSDRWHEEVFDTWQNTNNNQQICLLYYILMDYLNLRNIKDLERNACANIFSYLMSSNLFNKTCFSRAYEQFAEDFPDLLVDVPNGWTYVFQFLGPLLHEHLITFSDIWHKNWSNNKTCTERFVNALVSYFTKEFGANYMKDLWHKDFKLDRGQTFKSDQVQWRQFVAANKLQFLFDSKLKPEITLTNANNNSSAIIERHVQRLEILLSSPNNSNLALDYINTNVNINNNFLKKLTRFLCCDYAIKTKTTMSANSRTSSTTTSKNSSTCSNTSSSSSNTKRADLLSSLKCAQLNTKAFHNNCLPILRLCLDGHEDHELACLDSVVDAIQQEYDTNAANDLICEIFNILYDFEVIAKESFEKWYKQRLLEPKESKKPINRPLRSLLNGFMQKIL